ncbi:MAG: glycosyltransferase, partial [Verrucomicrobiota bacterium]
DSRFKGIYLARNFGQPGAILAGFSNASGDLVAYCDDDGQCPLDQADEFVKKIEEGADVVWAQYEERKHGILSRIGSKLNALMVRSLIGRPPGISVSNFFFARRFVIEEVLRCKNPSPYIGGLILSATSRMDAVPAEHRSRLHGKSNYSLKRLIHLWINGLTGFSVVPLRIASIIGFLTSTTGFLYAAVIITLKIMNPEMPLGYSSIMAVMLFMFGTVLLLMGLMGEYIGRLYLSSNSVPQYVIREIFSKPEE